MQKQRKMFSEHLIRQVKERKLLDMKNELEKIDISSERAFKDFALKLEAHIDNLDNFVAGLMEEISNNYNTMTKALTTLKKEEDPELWEKNPLKPFVEKYEEILTDLINLLGYLGWIIMFYKTAVEKYEGIIDYQLQQQTELEKIKLEKDFFDKTVDRIMSSYEKELKDKVTRIEKIVEEAERKINIYDKKLSAYDETIQILNTRMIEVLNLITSLKTESKPQEEIIKKTTKIKSEVEKPLPSDYVKDIEIEQPQEEKPKKEEQKEEAKPKKKQDKQKKQDEEPEDEDIEDSEDIMDLDDLLEDEDLE